jgi:Uncharacterised protein family UPF0547
MSTSITCHRCGLPFEPGEGCGGKFARCPKCRSYNSLPGADPTPAYDCAEPFKNCPHCDQELPTKAILCARCGYNFKTGRVIKARRSFKPIVHHWGGNVPMRLAIAGVLVLLCAPLVYWVDRSAAVAALAAWPLAVIVSAGGFRTATLRRDRRGKCSLITRPWVCFVPLPGRTLRLDRCSMRVEPDLEGGGLANWVQLLLGERLRLRIVFLPAVGLLYLYAMLAVGKYVLTLAEDCGSRVERTIIYRCRSEDTMREIADTLCEVAGLSYG